jgi:replicative DNA helicase
MSQSNNKPDLSRHAYSPERVVDNTLAVIDQRIATRGQGIKPMLPGMQEVLSTWRPGELIGVLGYTSNGKSSLVTYIVNQNAQILKSAQATNPENNHAIAFISWEQAVEEQTVVDLARVAYINPGKIFKGEITPEELRKIKEEGAPQRKKLPVWLVGHSIHDDRRRPKLSMADVLDIVIWMEEIAGLKLDLIVLDYLQRIRRMKSDMREAYMDNVDAAKDLALRCPVLLVSQAGRQVLNRPDPMPDLEDSQETSNFEQSCDNMFGVFMPKQRYRIGAKMNYHGYKYIVTEKLLMLGILKQKMGIAPLTRAFTMEYGGTDMIPVEGIPVIKLTEDDKVREGKSK